ncbi:phage integrase N-terminal SAM-like domain-containing protein [Nostocaceae cyanobacterium CENA369]|uniref:Phage integrase N-terminal SAM-like domain-containing protein n=1 Tax=Dendronalium phyllosphericum CENA369 TaxID=1725256 RepID=A0A8J7LC26_9NOST|nr:phage integrase N-terminal SAM-like domain-containing protein [Dendronalium phyllosphericum]MBH8572422.1 phage integrase N-terminal SAM-like domain-containing protein [Dendronalium phyllosphericum CENA369]
MQERSKKLLEQVHKTIRLKHYSYKTEKSHIDRIRRYIFVHNKRHPQDMENAEIEAFTKHLAVKENIAASTQNPS